MRIIKTELKKLKHRHIGLLYAAGFLVTILWMLWAMNDMDKVVTHQGYYYLLISFPLMNAIFLPVILAAAESRLCDIEWKGDTLKLLCTLQSRFSLYHTKLLFGFLYLLMFSLAETAAILLLGRCFQVEQPLPLFQLFLFFCSTLAVSLVLLLIQQPLSLLSGNQLLPMFVGIGGAFIGLFSWFFPSLPIRYFLPWGYYCVGTTINMNYEEATRTVTYYPIDYPLSSLLVLVFFGITAYLVGKSLFLKKEVS